MAYPKDLFCINAYNPRSLGGGSLYPRGRQPKEDIYSSHDILPLTIEFSFSVWVGARVKARVLT